MEIVVKDASGRPIFVDRLRRKGDASYIAFDLLWLNGKDLRSKLLIQRKRALRRVLGIRSNSPRKRYACLAVVATCSTQW